MSLETAQQSIELMLAESPNEKRYSVVFFGGEPLSNLKLIRAVVDYCEARFAQLGKQVDFVMTTNATLLTDEIVDWLDEHRFGLSISMDGPEAIHDRNRRTVGGKGTYRTVSDKARKLLARYNARPGRRPRHAHPRHHRGRAHLGPPVQRARLCRGRFRARSPRATSTPSTSRSTSCTRSLPASSGWVSATWSEALQGPHHRLFQPAPADHRPARRPAQGAALRRGAEDAGGGPRRRPQPLPPLHRLLAADLRRRARPASRKRPWARSSTSGWTAAAPAARPAASATSAPAAATTRATPATRTRRTRPTTTANSCATGSTSASSVYSEIMAKNPSFIDRFISPRKVH
jgi:hypothetical protein